MLKSVSQRAVNIAYGTIFTRNKQGISLSWNTIQYRGMVSKRNPAFKRERPPPFPYLEKDYDFLWSCWDHTYTRFDENTKLIVIEGPPGCGKHELAKHIADEFGMNYMGDLTTDVMYINHYGYDMRNLDHLMPDSVKSYDEKKFLQDPSHTNVAAYQATKYRIRFAHYIDALAHLLNTGQGVVLVRSPYSSGAFTHALREMNWITPQAKHYNIEIVRHSILYLLRPHLIIYMDVPPDATVNNIKKRNNPIEINSKVNCVDFYGHLQEYYKRVYLREAGIHSKLLMYNWIEEGDTDVVVEDIERLEFEKHLVPFETPSYDLKLTDWRQMEEEMDAIRVRYSSQKQEYMGRLATVHHYDCPEMWVSGNDMEVWENVWYSAPGMEYAKGYNYLRGDKNIWLKSRNYTRWEPTC